MVATSTKFEGKNLSTSLNFTPAALRSTAVLCKCTCLYLDRTRRSRPHSPMLKRAVHKQALHVSIVKHETSIRLNQMVLDPLAAVAIAH
jgi:hypothetical protein